MSDLDSILADKRDKASKAASSFATLFGEEVRQHRQQLNLTQEELTFVLRKCGIRVTQTYISRLEVGQRKNPSAQLVIALASILSISIDRVVSAAQSVDSKK
jgi:transcriptional regulator with XRE-family HTH domain